MLSIFFSCLLGKKLKEKYFSMNKVSFSHSIQGRTKGRRRGYSWPVPYVFNLFLVLKVESKGNIGSPRTKHWNTHSYKDTTRNTNTETWRHKQTDTHISKARQPDRHTDGRRTGEGVACVLACVRKTSQKNEVESHVGNLEISSLI